MFWSGQSLSSTSSPEHWLSSSLGTGKPESRSRQARKRFWMETMVAPPTTPPTKALSWSEDDNMQGEQRVHSDHSLRITAGRKENDKVEHITEEKESKTFNIQVSYHHILWCHNAKPLHGKGCRTKNKTITEICHGLSLFQCNMMQIKICYMLTKLELELDFLTIFLARCVVMSANVRLL